MRSWPKIIQGGLIAGGCAIERVRLTYLIILLIERRSQMLSTQRLQTLLFRKAFAVPYRSGSFASSFMVLFNIVGFTRNRPGRRPLAGILHSRDFPPRVIPSRIIPS